MLSSPHHSLRRLGVFLPHPEGGIKSFLGSTVIVEIKAGILDEVIQSPCFDSGLVLLWNVWFTREDWKNFTL